MARRGAQPCAHVDPATSLSRCRCLCASLRQYCLSSAVHTLCFPSSSKSCCREIKQKPSKHNPPLPLPSLGCKHRLCPSTSSRGSGFRCFFVSCLVVADKVPPAARLPAGSVGNFLLETSVLGQTCSTGPSQSIPSSSCCCCCWSSLHLQLFSQLLGLQMGRKGCGGSCLVLHGLCCSSV